MSVDVIFSTPNWERVAKLLYHSIHLVGCKELGETRSQRRPRCVAQVTGVSVGGGVIEVVLRYESGGSTREERSADRVRVRTVFIADLAQ